jgi:ubiquinone/menaquinone biosynthesis C-methylase UbiE
MTDQDAILEHYGTEPLVRRVEVALRQAGLDRPGVDWSAFAPLDEFHVRGLAATRDLAAALGPEADTSVLDVGSGLGGPARLLAASYGCQVTGVDLSREFVDVATMLTARAGLAEQVRFRQGDALELPFPDGSFEHAWTQHTAMNIQDRGRFYAEIRRAIKPGARFAMHDIVTGDGKPLIFPVPWSRTPETSFLLSSNETRTALAAAGFEEVSFSDQTELTLEWFGEQRRRAASAARLAPAEVGLGVVMGARFADMTSNLHANLIEGRVGVVALVVRAHP